MAFRSNINLNFVRATTNEINFNITGGTTTNINCSNYESITVNLTLTGSTTTLNLTNLSENSIIDLSIYKTYSADTTITLNTGSTTFIGFTDVQQQSQVSLTGGSDTYWEMSIKSTGYYNGSNLICFVVNPNQLT
jgi:hypothetical protein